MDRAPLRAEGQVVCALLASVPPLNQLSLLMSLGCVLLLLTPTQPTVTALAGSGLLAGIGQSYLNWRVTLNRELIPLLLQMGTAPFDRAIAPLFPRWRAPSAEQDLASRLDGARWLFRYQCAAVLLQLFSVTGAVTLNL